MKKNVLIIALTQGEWWKAMEKAILAKGMQLLRVTQLREAFYRLENEVFSVILLEDDIEGRRQRDFLDGVRLCPFGVTTPVVLVGPETQPKERAVLVSVLDQYFPISIDPDVVSDFLLETYELRRQQAKRGQLGVVAVPQILYQASRFRMDGAVVLEKQDEKCVVYFEKGQVVFASSNRDESRFGEFLVSRGVITREQLIHAVSVMESAGKRMGRVLVDEGFLKPQVLQTLLQSQIKHIVFNLFDWSSGEFYILFNEGCDNDSVIAHVEVPHLVLEGIRIRCQEPFLTKEFEPFDSRVSLAIPLDEIHTRMTLGKNEYDFLRIIGEGRPIQDLLNLNSYSRLDSLRLLYGFKTLGLLAIEKGIYTKAQALPSVDERAKAVRELFSPKQETNRGQGPQSVSANVPAKPKNSRRMYLAGAASMTVAFTLFFLIVTLFDSQHSREGQTKERSLSFVPDPKLETEEVRILRSEKKEEALVIKEMKAVPVEVPPVIEKVVSTPVPTSSPSVVQEEDEVSKLNAVAKRHKKAGRLHEALSVYQRLRILAPSRVDVMIDMGDVLFELDRSGEAIEVLEKAKGLTPSDPSPYLALGTIYLMRNENEGAKESFERYLSLVKNSNETRPRITEVKRILKNLENQP